MLAQILGFLTAILDIGGRVAKNLVITIVLFIVAILFLLLGTLTALAKIVS